MLLSVEQKKCIFSYLVSKNRTFILHKVPQVTQIKIESALRKDCASLLCYSSGSLFLQLGFLPLLTPHGRFFNCKLAIKHNFDEFLLNLFFIFFNFKNICTFQFFDTTSGIFDSLIKNFLHFFSIKNAYTFFFFFNLDLPLKIKIQANLINQFFKKLSIFNYLNFHGFSVLKF